MLNRLILPRLVALLTLLLAAGVAGAQEAPTTPTAVRLRIAHLAPFVGSDSATIQIQIDGAAVGGSLAYGDRTAYLPLSGGAGARSVQVLRDGAVALTDSIALADGDNSLIITGDAEQVPLGVLLIDDNLAGPDEGMIGLRVTHVAAIGATIESTLVDVCSQSGQLFHNSAAGLRYNRTAPLLAYRMLAAGTYDLKATRFVDGAPCAGAVVIDPPPIPLAAGTKTNLFLVGDGNNQPLAAFTFEEGLIGDDSPTQRQLNLPVVLAD